MIMKHYNEPKTELMELCSENLLWGGSPVPEPIGGGSYEPTPGRGWPFVEPHP